MISEIKTIVKKFDVGDRQLKFFGIFCAALLMVLYVWHLPSVLLILFSLALLIPAFLAPRALLPLVKVLIALTYPIGWMISRVLLISLYIVILTPIGALRRVFRAGSWHISGEESYWDDVEPNTHYDRMSL